MIQQLKKTMRHGSAEEKRKHLFRVLGAAVAVITVLYGAYYVFVASNHVETDNAYVAADIAQITPSTGGTVKDIRVSDTDAVKAGDILVVIDDVDTRLALARAKAELAKAQVDLDRTRVDYERRMSLAKTGSVSGEEVTNATKAYKAAQAVHDAAQIVVEQAQVDFDRTIVKSPVDGVVAKRQVQLGQRIQAGFTMMSVVPLQKVYVNANFKEVQLRKVKIGQPVELTSDIYGGSVVFHGKVAGVSGGTGSAFAVIPAQNATGNWIKVVQRLPVRIELNPAELAKHPLSVGLSMVADIDISGRD